MEARLATYPVLTAVRLFVECRAAGYTGGYSQRATPTPSSNAGARGAS
jgi:hypothetical protein